MSTTDYTTFLEDRDKSYLAPLRSLALLREKCLDIRQQLRRILKYMPNILKRKWEDDWMIRLEGPYDCFCAILVRYIGNRAFDQLRELLAVAYLTHEHAALWPQGVGRMAVLEAIVSVLDSMTVDITMLRATTSDVDQHSDMISASNWFERRRKDIQNGVADARTAWRKARGAIQAVAMDAATGTANFQINGMRAIHPSECLNGKDQRTGMIFDEITVTMYPLSDQSIVESLTESIYTQMRCTATRTLTL
jgi:hypothetical protein